MKRVRVRLDYVLQLPDASDPKVLSDPARLALFGITADRQNEVFYIETGARVNLVMNPRKLTVRKVK
jgi:hypothetical protein